MASRVEDPETQILGSPESFPALSDAQLERATSGLPVRAHGAGDVLLEPGQSPPGIFVAARWPLGRSPFLLETTLPGIFAVGDVRSGNLKRVASAVGEGSIAVALVHRVL